MDVGWTGPKDLVRFAIVGYLACIFGMGSAPTLDRVLNGKSRSGMEKWWNLPAEGTVEHLVKVHHQLLDYGVEASGLLSGVRAHLQ